MDLNKDQIWQTVLAKVESSVSKPNFLTWFQETGIMNFDAGMATVYVPNGFAREWLKNKYHKLILSALKELSPEVRDVSYVVAKVEGAGEALARRLQRRRRLESQLGHATEDAMSLKELAVDPATDLNPRYALDNFVVGTFNELAHAAAQSVIGNLGISRDYNPLFIYGGVGLGKTHLIQAIGNEVLKRNPNLVVKYVPAEKYMVEIVEALKAQEMNKLKEKYRTVDLLIMDDIQFISKTEKMQEEFFHTFNSLYEKSKQIIISSDRPPKAISTLEERLRSRFEGGMIADIGVPDFETRFIILKAKVEAKNLQISEEVLKFIAENVKTNIRELEGALNQVVMASRLALRPLSAEELKRVVETKLNAPKKFATAKKIIKIVADFYDIEERILLNRSRRRDVVRPRQVAMYLLREDLKTSYPSIGDKFGGRDHTTAIHSCEKVAEELEINPDLENELQLIRERIYQN